MPKVMEIIEKETKGKSYHTYKYSYDSIGLPSIDYDDDPNKVMKWKDSGETDSPKGAVDLKHLADQLQQLGETPLLKYFLDGSRHVFKVDDIAYNKQVFPVVAGQIGVGCCRRENKRMQKERFYRELVLALPDKANADGWDDAAYFAAKVKKLNESEELMLATAEEINYALGLNDIRNPLVCGYLEMYDGTKGCEKVTLPVNLNSKFIIGPEGAHLNISGISGLASKTSYAMFLLKAIQDSYMKKGPQNDDSEDSVAFVLFNVKGKDLLAIDQVNDFFDERNPEQARNETFAKYEQLGLSAEPFKNVHYYYPYSLPKTRHWNTYMTPEEVADNIKKKKAKKYKYIYKYDKDNLDLIEKNIRIKNILQIQGLTKSALLHYLHFIGI